MSDETAPAPQAPQGARGGTGCFKGLLVLFAALFAGAALLLWFFRDTLREGAAWVDELSESIVSQELSETFRQSVTQISSTNGDVLEVAVLRTDETVTKRDSKGLFNDMIYLGTTTSEIRAPVVYRYHIKLSDPWDLRIDNGRVIVRAPQIRPSLPPAFETQTMQKRSESGWLRFNAAENLSQLEKDLTPSLERRAGKKHLIDLVREPARKSVAEFVKRWLLTQPAVKAEGVNSIIVLFPEELQNESDLMLSVPAEPLKGP